MYDYSNCEIVPLHRIKKVTVGLAEKYHERKSIC